MSLPRILAAAAVALAFAQSALAEDKVASIVEEWKNSAHADITAEAFTHWNKEGEIPASCAMCHSGAGFRSFHGLDQSPVGEVSGPVPTGGVIDCDTCHAKGAGEIAQVRFPSGATLAAAPMNATCFTCHQGRQSGAGVAKAIAGMDPDTINPDLGFLNPHYAAAAATLMGNAAAGPFEYEGKTYAGPFTHAPKFQVCSDCHSPHSLKVKATLCVDCHKTDVVTSIRSAAIDYDADGNVTEGVAGEIATLQENLAAAIIAYSRDKLSQPVAYAPHSYPYFFNDTNGNGVAEEDEAVYPNRYASWTPRLLTAAYNYQFALKDPGAFAHNPKYAMQILIDSIEDLTGAPVAGAVRP